jgi:hypothetical protein
MIQLSIVARIALTFIIGTSLALFLAQNDRRFKAMCEEKIKKLFQDTFCCVVQEGELDAINFFTGTLRGKNIKVVAPDGSWQWQSPLLELKIPFLFSLVNKKIALEITLQNVVANSFLIDNQPRIIEHIRAIVDGPEGLPVMLRSLSLDKSELELNNDETRLHTQFNFIINGRNDGIKISCFIVNGELISKKFPEVQKINGSCIVEKLKNELMPLCTSSLLCTMKQPFLDGSKEIMAKAQSNGDEISVSFSMPERKEFVSINGALKSLNDYFFTVHTSVPLELLGKIFAPTYQSPITGCISGTVQCQGTAQNGNEIQCDLRIKDMKLGSISVGSIDLSGKRNKGLWGALFSVQAPFDTSWQGIMKFDESLNRGSLKCDLKKCDVAEGTVLRMLPEKTNICAQYDTINGLAGDYTICFENKDKAAYETAGNFLVSSNSFSLNGLFGDADYSLALLNKNGDACLHGKCIMEDKELIHFECSGEKSVRVDIDYRVIRSLFRQVFNVSAKGEGTIGLRAHYHDGIIAGGIQMNQGTIQISPTYNFIKNINADIILDLNTYRMILTDGRIDLHEGSITSKRAVIMLDKAGALQFMHIPCVLEKVFINIEKECFIVLSGNSLFSKNGEGAHIYGRLVMDKGQLKKNIFSLITSKQHIAPFKIPFEQTAFDGALDIGLMTRKPLSIKTSFLDTDALFDWHVQGTVQDPIVTGKIALSRGLLNFPYKPLYITQGKIFVAPPNVLDPEVALLAKGRVRQYDITLRIGGSALHPHIHFDATPPLMEEQIITLLLIGSESGSLSLIMPTLIMNNVQHLLFGPEQSLTKLESYFKSLLSPLKNIRIVPSFTDQTARGGLRGALEIDVNDQLHGTVQKNFNQLEDTKFEVEYLFSDDITLRGIKDERGDLGGEIEVKWKF